jgi:hypothetical protein
MGIKVSAKGGKDFDPVPVGVHMAICSQIIHVGVQHYDNSKYPDKDQVYFKFEIPEVRVKWEKAGVEQEGPATIGATFGLSIGEKSKLRPFLEGWRGKPFSQEEAADFDVTRFLGKACQLNVVHEQGRDGKTRANIAGAFGLIKEQKEKLAANPKLAEVEQPGGPIWYSPEDHNQAVYDKLPEWLRKKIDGRVKPKTEAEMSQLTGVTTGDFDDDIPF